MCHIQRLFHFKQYALFVQRFINDEHIETFPEIVFTQNRISKVSLGVFYVPCVFGTFFIMAPRNVLSFVVLTLLLQIYIKQRLSEFYDK